MTRFGRCSYFVIVDLDTEEHTVKQNEGTIALGGAGVKALSFCRLWSQRGHYRACGANASRALEAAGIKVFVMDSGTVRDAIKAHGGEINPGFRGHNRLAYRT